MFLVKNKTGVISKPLPTTKTKKRTVVKVDSDNWSGVSILGSLVRR